MSADSLPQVAAAGPAWQRLPQALADFGLSRLPPAGDDRRFLVAIGCAILLHALPLLAMIGWGGAGTESAVGAGDPAGSQGGVNVELIDAAEYDRRYISFSAGKDRTDTEANPAAPQPVSQPAPELRPTTFDPVPAADQPQEPAPVRQTPKLSKADLAEILEITKLDADIAISATSRASIANQGQASEFVRHVLRRLKQTMPKPNGIIGTVVIGVILTEQGKVEWVGVIKSSNRRELDQRVVDGVRTTQFEAPRAPVPPSERRFQITYQYD